MDLINKASHVRSAVLFTALALVVANRVAAQNFAPPASPGLLLLDLAGTSIPADNVVTPYDSTTDPGLQFTATSTTSFVTFVFRHDPGFFTFDNVSVVDATSLSGNLLTNGDFLTPPDLTPGVATGWSYFTQTGITFQGEEATPSSGGGWYDGATGGYDGIDQSFTTTVGHSYDVSFTLSQWNENNVYPPSGNYQPTSTNGASNIYYGDGIDMLAYGGSTLPTTSVPDESSTFVLLLGSLGLVAFWKRRALGRAIA